MKKTQEEKNVEAWKDYLNPDWWREQESYHPKAKVEYEVIMAGGSMIPNYELGFTVINKKDRAVKGAGIYMERCLLHEFIERAFYDRYMVGEGWGVSMDYIEDDSK